MIKALLFDVNGTVSDILTDESGAEIYRVLANLLSYQGVELAPDTVRDLFWEINKRQRRESLEEHPEFDAVKIFAEIIKEHASSYTLSLPAAKRQYLPLFLAETFRAASRYRLQLYPGVRKVLDSLATRYRLAAVSDGQAVWARPELHSVGLLDVFDPLIISSDLGFRKPDRRIYQTALDKLALRPQEVIFVGNDMYRDIWGPHQIGMKTVFFKSNQGDHSPQNVEADYIIYRFEELPEAVSFIEKKYFNKKI